MRNSLIIIFLSLFVSSCKEQDEPIGKIADNAVGQVLLINEGNFQQGNSSLGSFNPKTGDYNNQVFNEVNGFPIGDVFNSVTKIGNEYWCVINNSGKIYVLDSASRKVTHTISGLTSPRFACYADGYNKVYVTDLYADKVSIVSTETYTTIGAIDLNGWTELMLMAGDRLYVTSNERPLIYLINPNTDQIEDSLKVGNLTNSLLRANNATILALCEGKLGSNELAELFVIDPKARQISNKITYKQGEKPRFLRMNEVDKRIFLINKKLQELDVFSFNLKQEIDIETGNIYAFNISPNGDFYIGDAGNYVGRSKINVYNQADFKIKTSFQGGINTNSFVFE